MTLDTYGHLFEDRLDEVGNAMDAARAAAQARRAALRVLPRVAPALPEPDFVLRRGNGPEQRLRWSGPLFGLVPRPDANRRYRLARDDRGRRALGTPPLVPPTGFEPALPP